MLSQIRSLLSKVAALARREQIADDFEEEVRVHLALLTAEYERRGMSPDAAARAARLEFGGVTQIREQNRAQWGFQWIETLGQDLRHAARLMRRNPGFTLIAVLTLSVGIGLNTVVFTAYESVALRPLAVREPGGVLRLMNWFESGYRDDEIARAEYEFLKTNARSFSEVAASSAPLRVLARGAVSAEGEVVVARLVSGNYFGLLGVAPDLGRTFNPEEDATAQPVAVISHRFWKRRFLSDPQILGRTLLLNGAPITFIGVAPESFAGTGSPPEIPDLWVPLGMEQQIAMKSGIPTQILARRKAATSQRQVDSELQTLQSRIQELPVDPEGKRGKIRKITANQATYFDSTGGGFEAFQWVIAGLMAAVTAVLLIGCVNLVNLLLARAAARQREIAVRCALGAGRGRIIRQLCTESALLGLLGGAGGLAISIVLCRYLANTLATELAIFGTGADSLFVDASPSLAVFAYTALVSIAAGVLVGLVPARLAARRDANSAIKQETSEQLGGRSRMRSFLIAAQIAACVTLLVGAGLLGRGFLASAHVETGLDVEHSIIAMLPQAALGNNPQQRAARVAEVMRRLEAIPQICAAGRAFQLPMMGHSTAPFQPAGGSIRFESPEARSLFNNVSPGYFDALGIPLLRGRSFTQPEVDQHAAVAVVSEATAKRFWPGEDPLGKRLETPRGLRFGHIDGRTFTIIGVAKSVRSTNLSKVDDGYVYFPGSYDDAPVLLVRGSGLPATTIPLIRDAVMGVDRQSALQMTVIGIESGPIRLQRLMTEAPALVAAVLGLLALALAAVGIYGVVSYLVAQRTREIGVRMALGASKRQVLSLVFLEALRPVMWGVPFGLAGSAALSAVLSSMTVMVENPDPLFGVNPWSPETLIGVVGFLVFIVWLASWIPARRAMRVDPAAALRSE